MKKKKMHSIQSTQKPVLVSILVPVYNEENTLKDILDVVCRLPISLYEVIIVDDASADRSPAIISSFQKKFNSKNVALTVYTHKKNRGKGAAIKTALRHSKGEYFVIQDADSEYDPKDLPALLAYAMENKSDVVYGSRFLGEMHNMPRANYYANRFYNFLLRRLYKTKITDMHTCHKLIKTDLFKEFRIDAEGFGYASEVISKILKRGIEIHEVPISFYGRTKKDGKKINFKDGIECVYQIFRYRFSKRSY